MKIKLISLHVDDQEKALRFYTEVLGFAKKADFSQGPYRWLTVASPEDPDGTELQLALNDNPAARAYQQAMFQQGQPAAMFFSDDVKGDYERIKARGAEFTMAPTEVPGATIAKLNDTCGNLIQINQLCAGRASVQPDRCGRRRSLADSGDLGYTRVARKLLRTPVKVVYSGRQPLCADSTRSSDGEIDRGHARFRDRLLRPRGDGTCRRSAEHRRRAGRRPGLL